MQMHRPMTLTGLALAAFLLGGCATVVREPTVPQRSVYRDMPAPQSESRPPPPVAGYNWVPGHYVWREGDWRWQPGSYVPVIVRQMPPPLVEQVPYAPSPRHVYIRGHWQWGGSDWVWVRGRWVEG